MLSWYKYYKDTKEMERYRNRNFKSLESMIEIHNIITTSPNEVRVEVMQISLMRVYSQIDFYQDEIAKIDRIVVDFKGNEERLNKYGRALMNNYLAIQDELRDIIDTLREVADGIKIEIDKK